jgi:hypothetical protein
VSDEQQDPGQEAQEKNPETAPEQPYDDFAVFLVKDAPASHEELSVAMAQLAAAVQETGKTGRIQYTVEIKKAKGVDMVLVTDSVKTNIPKPDREAIGMRFVHKGGHLDEYPPGQAPFAGMGRNDLGGSK